MKTSNFLIDLATIRDSVYDLVHTIDVNELNWLSHMWINNFSIHKSPEPSISIIGENTVRLEWDTYDNFIDLTINLTDHTGELYAWYKVDNNPIHWHDLNLDNKTEWGRIQYIIYYGKTPSLNNIKDACISAIKVTHLVLQQNDILLEKTKYFKSAVKKFQEMQHPTPMDIMNLVQYVKMHDPYGEMLKTAFRDANINLKYFYHPETIITDSQ